MPNIFSRTFAGSLRARGLQAIYCPQPGRSEQVVTKAETSKRFEATSTGKRFLEPRSGPSSRIRTSHSCAPFKPKTSQLRSGKISKSSTHLDIGQLMCTPFARLMFPLESATRFRQTQRLSTGWLWRFWMASRLPTTLATATHFGSPKPTSDYLLTYFQLRNCSLNGTSNRKPDGRIAVAQT